ncbi:GTPase IMAP family member 9-like, partial [Tachysurus ichikawai]
MVLFVYGNEWEKSKRCPEELLCEDVWTKYFILENNEENAEELFRRVEAMTLRKQSRFFIQRSYENLMKVYFEPWEKAQAYKEMRLKRELEELKIEQCQKEEESKTLRQTVRDLREELEASRHDDSVLQEELETARCSEEQLREEPVMIEGSEAGQWTYLWRNSKEDLNPN